MEAFLIGIVVNYAAYANYPMSRPDNPDWSSELSSIQSLTR